MIDFEWEFEPVSAEEVEEVIRDLAADLPGKVYAPENQEIGCQYTHAGQVPGCIVGAALHQLGRGIPYEHGLNTSKDVHDLNIEGLITGDTGWLFKVQSEQDSGTPWGEAVQEADAYRERVNSRDDEDLDDWDY